MEQMGARVGSLVSSAVVLAAVSVLVSAANGQPAPALAQGEPPAPVRVVHAFQEAWNSGRVERALPFFADDAVVIDPRSGGTHTGREAVFRWLAAQLGQETRIVAGWGYDVAQESGDAVRWHARLSTFTTRALGAPPVEAAVETLVRGDRIVRHTVAIDAASLSRQRGAVRDAIARHTAQLEAAGPAPGSLPPVPTYAPYQPIHLPNADDRRAPAPLPWLVVGAASVACVALAMLKRPPRP